MKYLKIFFISVIISVFISSCKNNEDANKVKVVPVNVKIEKIKPSKFTEAIQLAGTVKAYEDVNISPEEGGVIKEWIVKKGKYVQKGDLIVVLKDEVLKASYDAAEAQYKTAELNLEKQKAVYEQQGISELQYKNLQYARDAAKANADLMRARWERTQIKSTINGIVENTALGNLLNEGEFAPPGVPIVRVVNNFVVKIQAEVPEIYSNEFKVGSPAIITFDALPNDTIKGKVTFVSSAVSAVNRTMQVEIVVVNQNRKLKPEMIAKVKLMRATKNDAIVISENIIQMVDKDKYVVYIEKNGKAYERVIKLGGRQGNLVEVLDGLNIGDNLIVVGYQNLVNGSEVVITK